MSKAQVQAKSAHTKLPKRVKTHTKPVVTPSNGLVKERVDTAVETDTPLLDGLDTKAPVKTSPGPPPATLSTTEAPISPTKSDPKTEATNKTTAMLERFRTSEIDAKKLGKSFTANVKDSGEAAQAVVELTKHLSAEEKTAFFSGEGKQLLQYIANGVKGAKGRDLVSTDYDAAVQGLLRAGENGGSEQAKAIANTLQGVEGNAFFQRAIARGIKQGNGGMVAAHLAKETGNPELRAHVQGAFAGAQNDFDGARKNQASVNQRWSTHLRAANQAAQTPSLFESNTLAASRREFERDKLDPAKARTEAAAGVFTSTLAGSDILKGPNQKFSPDTVKSINALPQTAAGRAAVVDQLQKLGSGETSWLTRAGGSVDKKTKVLFKSMLQKGALQGLAVSRAGGDPTSGTQVLAGTAKLLDQTGDPKLANAIRGAAKDLLKARTPEDRQAILNTHGKDLSPKDREFLKRLGVFGSAGAEFREKHGETGFNKVAKAASHGERFGLALQGRAPGLGELGAVSGALDAILSETSTFKDYARATLNLGEAGNSLVNGLFAAGSTGLKKLKLLEKGLGVGGMAFDVLDMADAVKEGRMLDAGKAAASLLATAGRVFGFLGKRSLGVVGLGITATEIYQAVSSDLEEGKATKDLLASAAARALGLKGPAASGHLAAFAVGRDGMNLDRLKKMADKLGIKPAELARRVFEEKDGFISQQLQQAISGLELDPKAGSKRDMNRQAEQYRKILELQRSKPADPNKAITWSHQVRENLAKHMQAYDRSQK